MKVVSSKCICRTNSNKKAKKIVLSDEKGRRKCGNIKEKQYLCHRNARFTTWETVMYSKHSLALLFCL